MFTKFFNQFFNGKTFYSSWTFWGIFLYGAVHGGLTEAFQAGYIEMSPILDTFNSVAEKSGLLLTILGLRKGAGR